MLIWMRSVKLPDGYVPEIWIMSSVLQLSVNFTRKMIFWRSASGSVVQKLIIFRLTVIRREF